MMDLVFDLVKILCSKKGEVALWLLCEEAEDIGIPRNEVVRLLRVWEDLGVMSVESEVVKLMKGLPAKEKRGLGGMEDG